MGIVEFAIHPIVVPIAVAFLVVGFVLGIAQYWR